jgi:hypothetical protein
MIDLVNEDVLRRKLDTVLEEKQEYITKILRLKPSTGTACWNAASKWAAH